MTNDTVFDSAIELPVAQLTEREKVLLGFAGRYERVHNQLQLLLNQGQISEWSKAHHKTVLPICHLVADQYPLVIFHGDVGTGKTATAECIANRIVRDSRAEDSVLFKLSNRVRGSGKVGEMGTLLTQAFAEIVEAAGKNRRAILIIDEGDSIAASRSQSQRGSTPLLRTLLKRGTMCQRSVHVQTQKIQPRIQARSHRAISPARCQLPPGGLRDWH